MAIRGHLHSYPTMQSQLNMQIQNANDLTLIQIKPLGGVFTLFYPTLLHASCIRI